MAVVFFVLAVAAEVIGTIAGFGSSTVFLPLALLFFDFKSALLLVACLHIFGNIARLQFFRRGLDRSLLLGFGLPSVASTIVGALLVGQLPQSTLKGILGLFLLVLGLLTLRGVVPTVRPNPTRLAVAGGVSGFLAGLIGTGGALRGASLHAFGLSKTRYLATAAAVALAVDVTRIPLYVSQGFLTARDVWYVPLLLVAAVVGSRIGKYVVDRIPQRRFAGAVAGAITLVGAAFLVGWLL